MRSQAKCFTHALSNLKASVHGCILHTLVQVTITKASSTPEPDSGGVADGAVLDASGVVSHTACSHQLDGSDCLLCLQAL